MRRLGCKTLVHLLTLLTLISCALKPGPAGVQDDQTSGYQAQLTSLLQQITSANQNLSCTTDAQCGFVMYVGPNFTSTNYADYECPMSVQLYYSIPNAGTTLPSLVTQYDTLFAQYTSYLKTLSDPLVGCPQFVLACIAASCQAGTCQQGTQFTNCN